MANEIFGIDFGGPAAAVVHQDRLVLAGGGAVPDVVATSRTGQWLDFDTGGADATEAHGFWFQQVSARGNRFHAILQQQGLLIFGDVGESAIPPGPFTAEGVEVRENSTIGSDIGRPPVIAGNLVVFIQSGGRDCRGIAWNEQQLKYLAPSLLTLSGNVFTKARDITYRPSSGRRGDTVYVIDEDGTLAVLLLRVGAGVREDDMPAWSRWETTGKVLGAAAPLGQACFIVERAGHVGLEVLAPEGEDRLDAAWRVDDEDNLGSMPAWMADASGLVYRIHSMDEDGNPVTNDVDTLPTSLAADEVLEVGLPYTRALETTQFVKQTQTGTSGRVRPARIVDAAVDFVLPGETASPDDTERLREVIFTIIPYSRRGRRRRLNGKPPRNMSGRIYTVRYPSRLGWRDRVAIELTSERHVDIVGVAYRAAA